jgi:mannose-6-phosphate isomerase-like protein (cupin superfamily)
VTALATPEVKQPVAIPAEWQRSPFDWFLDSEGIPVVTGFSVPELKAVEVAPWPRLDARGAYIRLTGSEDTNTAYMLEIAPGGATAPERHLYEECMFVVAGRGSCEVWNDAGQRQTFEWQRGSLFAIPLNCHHRFFNGSGREAARLMGCSTAPLMINLLHSNEFIFNCEHNFRDRFEAQEAFFSGDGTMYQGRVWETNFVPDVYDMKLQTWIERGAGGTNVNFELAGSALVAHISEFPVGTYKKAHRHGPGAHVIILDGHGFSVLWPEGEDITDIPWGPGAMFVPPGMWWHQHFNTGATPARYLAIRWGGSKYHITRYLNYQGIDQSAKKGGNQIEYEDQDPRIHRMFEERCAQRGVTVRMDAFPVRR